MSYLYEDNYQRPNRARQWLVALIILALIGFGYYQWRRDPAIFARLNDWARHSIDSLTGSHASAQPSQQQTPAKSGAQPGAAAESAQNQSPASPSTAQTNAAVPSPAPQQSASPSPATAASGAPASEPHAEPASPQTETPEPQPEQEATTEPSANKPSAMAAPAAAQHTTTSPRTAPDADLVSKADEYLYGRGVPKNCDQALVYLRAAAEHGNSSARSKLGGLYATGNCVPLDRPQAYSWFSRALASGDHNVWIERNMTMLWNQMSPAERSRVTH